MVMMNEVFDIRGGGRPTDSTHMHMQQISYSKLHPLQDLRATQGSVLR